MTERNRGAWFFEAGVWSVLYAFVGALGLFLGEAANMPTPFQPAAGVALAGALTRGGRSLPGLALGAAGLDLVWSRLHHVATPWWIHVLFAAAVLAQAAVGAWGVKRFVRQPLALADSRAIGRFFVAAAAAAVVSSAAAAVVGALHEPAGAWDAMRAASAWWFGQAAGSVIVAPMVWAWTGLPLVDWKPRRLMLALPMTVLAAVTALGFVHIARLDAERERNRFELEVSGAAAHLSAQLLEPERALEAVRGLFLGAQVVDRQAFQRATRAWLDRPGHLHAIGWSERLAYADIAAFEARAHAEGFEGLRVLSATGDGGVRPVRSDEQIVAIRFIEPYESNRLVPGINSKANPAIGPVIAAAMRTGGQAATPAFPLRLPGNIDRSAEPQGVVVYRALYRGEPGTDTARDKAAYGVVFATLRMSEILASVAREVPAGYALCLVDLDADRGPRRIAGAPACDRSDAPLTYRRALRFADRHWELRVGVPVAAGGVRPSSYTWPFALFGFAGLAALGAMLLAVTGRTRRVELAVAEAERAREAAVAANQAKSEFLSRMSHELRTPLNAVLGFTQLMETDQKQALGPQQRRWVGLIQQAGWHLLEMINDVLDLSRIESDQLELQTDAVWLMPLVEQTIAMVERAAQQRGIDVVLTTGADDLQIRADATRVKQILTNLLSNAVKYNVERGRIEVSCRHANGRAEIEVKDTGLGMSPAQLDQLFQPFNRLGRELTDLQGTGIGLVISRRLAEMMGGQLQVDSEAGKGSSFVLTLPLVADSVIIRTGFAPVDLAGPGNTRGRVVHCVEDNAINIELMRGILARRPWIRLDVSTTGQRALTAIRAQVPDLILLDLHLPDINGLDVLHRLKADPELAAIPVVVVSADAMEAQIEVALHAGAADFLTKPLDVRQFLSVIDTILAGLPQPAN